MRAKDIAVVVLVGTMVGSVLAYVLPPEYKSLEPEFSSTIPTPVAEPACTDEILALLDMVAFQAEQTGHHFDHAHRDHFMASRYRRLAQETRAVQKSCKRPAGLAVE
jgi:hypothetical protein